MYPEPQQNGWQHQPHHPSSGHGASAGGYQITCPKCHQASESVKAYTMMSFLLFIFVGAWWRTKRVVACASCMRSELLTSSAINLFTANVLSPIVFIWHAVLFVMTYDKGHSAEVYNYMG